MKTESWLDFFYLSCSNNIQVKVRFTQWGNTVNIWDNTNNDYKSSYAVCDYAIDHQPRSVTCAI